VEGSFVAQTTRFDYKSGEPLNSVVIVSCPHEGHTYRFLFGTGGEGYEQLRSLSAGDRINLEKVDGQLLINRLPVKRLYRKTLDGFMDRAGAGWKRLTGRKQPEADGIRHEE
jgi:hypothetical protein